jgi:Ni2+-binding GTPase involved in maturation of urease and hydrogenase
VLVISGVPGIGKTTLAEILLYAHLEKGYEPVVIQTDIREGRTLFNSPRRQIFTLTISWVTPFWARTVSQAE